MLLSRGKASKHNQRALCTSGNPESRRSGGLCPAFHPQTWPEISMPRLTLHAVTQCHTVHVAWPGTKEALNLLGQLRHKALIAEDHALHCSMSQQCQQSFSCAPRCWHSAEATPGASCTARPRSPLAGRCFTNHVSQDAAPRNATQESGRCRFGRHYLPFGCF